jgi:hypothetical protein
MIDARYFSRAHENVTGKYISAIVRNPIAQRHGLARFYVKNIMSFNVKVMCDDKSNRLK